MHTMCKEEQNNGNLRFQKSLIYDKRPDKNTPFSFSVISFEKLFLFKVDFENSSEILLSHKILRSAKP